MPDIVDRGMILGAGNVDRSAAFFSRRRPVNLPWASAFCV